MDSQEEEEFSRSENEEKRERGNTNKITSKERVAVKVNVRKAVGKKFRSGRSRLRKRRGLKSSRGSKTFPGNEATKKKRKNEDREDRKRRKREDKLGNRNSYLARLTFNRANAKIEMTETGESSSTVADNRPLDIDSLECDDRRFCIFFS